MTIQYLHLFGMIPTSVSAPLGKTLCALHDPIVPPFIVSSTWNTSPLLNDSSSSSDPRYWNWALNIANHLTRIRYRQVQMASAIRALHGISCECSSCSQHFLSFKGFSLGTPVFLSFKYRDT